MSGFFIDIKIFPRKSRLRNNSFKIRAFTFDFGILRNIWILSRNFGNFH